MTFYYDGGIVIGRPDSSKRLAMRGVLRSMSNKGDKSSSNAPRVFPISKSVGRNLQDDFGIRAYRHLQHTVAMKTSDCRIRVDRIPDNDGSYSISVGVDDPLSLRAGGFNSDGVEYRGHPILFVSFNFVSSLYFPATLRKGMYEDFEDMRVGRECNESNFPHLLQEMDQIISLYELMHRPRNSA